MFYSRGKEIWLPVYHNATAKLDGLVLRETSGSPRRAG